MESYIPFLPYPIITRILDEANLPLDVRIEFIHMFKLTPKKIIYKTHIKTTLDTMHNFQTIYIKEHNNPNLIVGNYGGEKFKIEISLEENGEIYFRLIAVTYDKRFVKCDNSIMNHTIFKARFTTKLCCNAHTGKIIE
jgi:hypothetical protein